MTCFHYCYSWLNDKSHWQLCCWSCVWSEWVISTVSSEQHKNQWRHAPPWQSTFITDHPILHHTGYSRFNYMHHIGLPSWGWSWSGQQKVTSMTFQSKFLKLCRNESFTFVKKIFSGSRICAKLAPKQDGSLVHKLSQLMTTVRRGSAAALYEGNPL